MGISKCKSINIDLKKETIKLTVSVSNISPTLWTKAEYQADTFMKKLHSFVIDFCSYQVQFLPSVKKKERLAFLLTQKAVDIGEYPFKEEKITEFVNKFLEILTELKSDKTLSKKGYITWSNGSGNATVFVEKYVRETLHTNIFARKQFDKLYYLLLKEMLPKEHILHFIEEGENNSDNTD